MPHNGGTLATRVPHCRRPTCTDKCATAPRATCSDFRAGCRGLHAARSGSRRSVALRSVFAAR
eukprot:8147022-Alexandrium_andersonii.AAC.1